MKKMLTEAWWGKTAAAVLVVLFFATCSKPDGDPIPECLTCNCKVNTPVEDIPWLKKIVTGTAPGMGIPDRVYSYIFKGIEVIYVVYPYSNTDDPSRVFNCQGYLIIAPYEYATRDNWSEFQSQRTSGKLLWTK